MRGAVLLAAVMLIAVGCGGRMQTQVDRSVVVRGVICYGNGAG